MNKNVPGESNDRRRKKDPVGSLWQSLREIVENEDGQWYEDDSDDEYTDFNRQDFNFWRRLDEEEEPAPLDSWLNA